eukprot:TRINITY_DN81750_c0_g1_i1.p1 TRINITY_DN81750_c0_g1~~TRINITY_DN81750_c0_g1_i1.p1  ORF type:complete len:302 (-),score=32.81 TRINITY_DN81750_c0_g1_i1:36-941(-)
MKFWSALWCFLVSGLELEVDCEDPSLLAVGFSRNPCNKTARLLRCSQAAPGDASCFDTEPPSEFQVLFTLYTGESFLARVYSSWAPVFAQRFWQLVNLGWWDEVAIYRNDYINASLNFVSQWGINGNPAVNSAWNDYKSSNASSRVRVSNTRGRLTFAMDAVVCNSTSPTDPCVPFRWYCSSTEYCARGFSTEIFVNYGNNSRLDASGFAPFAEVQSSDMIAVDEIGKLLGNLYGEVVVLCSANESNNSSPYCEYRNGKPAGVNSTRFGNEGNSYIASDFPKMYQMRIANAQVVGHHTQPR